MRETENEFTKDEELFYYSILEMKKGKQKNK